MYTSEEIKTILWNTFNLTVEAIELIDENNGCYKFNVYPEETSSLNDITAIAEDLYDSGLFDITLKNDYLEIEYLNPYVLEKKQFSLIYESINSWISFDDNQVNSLKKKFNTVNIKYHNNTFYTSIMKQLEDKKKLSKKQFDELKYLLDNGITRYEAGVLSTKN